MQYTKVGLVVIATIVLCAQAAVAREEDRIKYDDRVFVVLNQSHTQQDIEALGDMTCPHLCVHIQS